MKRHGSNTAVLDRKPPSQKPFETKLAAVRKLVGGMRTALYDAVKLCCDVFEDRAFRDYLRVERGLVVDDFVAADALDAELTESGFGFLELRTMLELFPDREQWQTTTLGDMHTAVLKRTEQHDERETKRAVTRVKLADHKEVCDERDRAVKRAESLEVDVRQRQDEVGMLRAQVANLEKQLAEANGRISELSAEIERLHRSRLAA